MDFTTKRVQNPVFPDTFQVNSDVPIALAEPIPVSAWERYMVVDGSSRHSMTCHARFWFSGRTSRTSLTEAIVKIAEQNPLLAAELVGNYWHPVKFNANTQVAWHACDSAGITWSHLPADDCRVRFDFYSGKLQALGIADPTIPNTDGYLLVIRYPHAVADGLAATLIVKQLAAALAQKSDPVVPIHELNNRHSAGLSSREWLRHGVFGVSRIWNYFVRKPRAWKNLDDSNESCSSDITCERITCEPAFLTKIRSTARKRGCQVNDLLIVAFFRTLARRSFDKTDFLRLGIPISTRQKSENQFCNLVSMVFLDRRPVSINHHSLLESITDEMQQIKKHRLGLSMIAFLRCACVARGRLLKLFLQNPTSKTTSVLTNLRKPFEGCEPFRLGDAMLVGTDSIVPIRPGTNIGLSVSEYAGKISLTLRFNSSICSSNDAMELLVDFYKQLQQIQ